MITTSLAGLALESDSALNSGLASEQPCAVAASEDIYAKSEEAFRTIGEAAAELGLKTHVLRFWETKFDDLRPMKRADGRRFYRPDDMEMLRKLQNLLHIQGLTIRGAIKALDGEVDLVPVGDELAEVAAPVETGASVRDLQDAVRSAVERGDFVAGAGEDPTTKSRLEMLLTDLTALKSRLDAVRAA